MTLVLAKQRWWQSFERIQTLAGRLHESVTKCHPVQALVQHAGQDCLSIKSLLKPNLNGQDAIDHGGIQPYSHREEPKLMEWQRERGRNWLLNFASEVNFLGAWSKGLRVSLLLSLYRGLGIFACDGWMVVSNASAREAAEENVVCFLFSVLCHSWSIQFSLFSLKDMLEPYYLCVHLQ